MKILLKRIIAILLAVCFLVSLTATAVSVGKDFQLGHMCGHGGFGFAGSNEGWGGIIPD